LAGKALLENYTWNCNTDCRGCDRTLRMSSALMKPQTIFKPRRPVIALSPQQVL
jgi:hypothetical protein